MASIDVVSWWNVVESSKASQTFNPEILVAASGKSTAKKTYLEPRANYEVHIDNPTTFSSN
jgi:hypothetical protein